MERKTVFYAFLVFLQIGSLLPTQLATKPLEVHFIGLKNGEAILIHSPHGQAALVDTGVALGGLQVIRYLKQRGIKRLDYLIVTHYDPDHMGAAVLIAEEFPIGTVYDNGQDLEPYLERTEKLREYQQEIRGRSDYRVLRAGDSFPFGEVRLEVLWPPAGELASKDFNSNSLVLRLTYGDSKVLLTSDLLEASEKQLIESGVELEADILKVGHHGSTDASHDAFIEQVGPGAAVITAFGSDPEKPSPVTLQKFADRGTPVYRTDLDGDICFFIQPDGSWKVESV